MAYGVRDSWAITFARRGSRSLRNTIRSANRRSPSGRPSFGYEFKNLTIFSAELDRFLNSPSGPLWKELETRGRKALLGAKQKVGVRSGALRNSITMEHTRSLFGQTVKIGSSLDYALMHHEGTRPHMIFPKEREVLRFSAGGRIVYTRAVRHPGTRPNRYLSSQLHNFSDLGSVRVITYGRM